MVNRRVWTTAVFVVVVGGVLGTFGYLGSQGGPPPMNRSAVYPGTFDPITRGHEDLVRRAATIFDRIVVAIAVNPGKAPLFSIDERVGVAQAALADVPGVEVQAYSGLTVDFARQNGIAVIIRGLRAVSDFSSSSALEREMASRRVSKQCF
jgi:pantetheine-phosphate adenylyltransferase